MLFEDVLTVKTDTANIALDKLSIDKLVGAGSDVILAVEKNPANANEIFLEGGFLFIEQENKA